jgi:quercetin dioxygenase-like cupin family protein
MKTAAVRVVGPKDGRAGFLGSIGVRFMIDGEEPGERFALVEHPMSARALAAPLHRHTREDEYSFVLEGGVGALLGDDVVIGGPGDLIFKPRNQWHTFWNAAELVELGGLTRADPQALSDLCARYEVEVDPDSVPGLVERFEVRFPGEPIR